MESSSSTQSSSYSWHQSHDQATVLLMVPYDASEEDILVIIEKDYLIASVKGQSPIVKGRLYSNVDASSSVWQLEPRGGRLSARERTTSSASTASNSSYAFIFDPEISSSFAASLDSGPVSDAEDVSSPALSSPTLSSTDESRAPSVPRRKSTRSNAASSRPISPSGAGVAGTGGRAGYPSTSIASSYSSLESLQTVRAGRLLTLHLEKEQSIIWPALIVGPCPETVSPYIHNSIIFDASHELEHQYNMDPTSLTLLALEHFDVRKDYEEAFECFLRAWHIAHVPTATMKLVSHYLPLPTMLDIGRYNMQQTAPRGTTTYYLQCIGGPAGLARLYLEAGLLHLEGAASALRSTSHSSLASLRMPDPTHDSRLLQPGNALGPEDRESAKRYFDRARILNPELDIPTLPPPASGDELQMPSIELQVAPDAVGARQRRRKLGAKALDEKMPVIEQKLDATEEDAWYLYVPGLIGAGTALVVVGVIGALSFSSWSRRNQGS